MLLAFSVFRPCISVHHIVDAYRRTISSHHIGGAYRRIHHHHHQNQNQRTNGNELTQPFAAPEMTAGLTITPEMTAHAPAHQIDPLTTSCAAPDYGRSIPRHPDPVPNHPSIDQIHPVSISPHSQRTAGPPRPDLVPNRPKARLNQDRRS